MVYHEEYAIIKAPMYTTPYPHARGEMKRRPNRRFGDGDDDGDEGDRPVHGETTFLSRYYFQEVMSSSSFAIDLTAIFVGISVHINLHFIIGVCIFIVGTWMLACDLVGSTTWMASGEDDVDWMVRVRRVLMWLRLIGLASVVGFSVWAAVVMIQRST